MDDPSAAKSSCSTDTSRVLSHIERLPTEVVQEIAAHLIRSVPRLDEVERPSDAPKLFYPSKLADLRATSRFLRCKTEYIFKQCFAVKIVPFHKRSLYRLYQLSRYTAYAALVQELFFIPYKASMDEDDLQDKQNDNQVALKAAMVDPKMAHLRLRHAEETSLLILALSGFNHLLAIEVSPDLQQTMSANVRRHSLLLHPPTMIMAAIMEGESKLKSLTFAESHERSNQGLIPRVFNRAAVVVNVFETLTSLTLTLTSRNLGPQLPDGLFKIIAAASNLKILSLALDRSSLIGRHLNTLSEGWRVFIALAVSTLHHLHLCELKGWDLVDTILQKFLLSHRNILCELRLVDCIVVGTWHDALQVLIGSETLQTLHLHQLGENWQRLYFPYTCDVFTDVDSDDDLIRVFHACCTARIAPWQNWDKSLNAIIKDFALTSDMVDPETDDAVAWYDIPLV